MAKHKTIKYAKLMVLRKNAKGLKSWRVLMKPFRFEMRLASVGAQLTLGGRLPIASRRLLDARADKASRFWFKPPSSPLVSFTSIPHSCAYEFIGDGFALLKMQVQNLQQVSGRKNTRRKSRKKSR